MPRLLFEKKANAIWISHLDLMRLFQRAFKRAGLPLTHTHGFNPRPSVSIALPLSVGVESSCELLDFDLDGESVAFDEIRDRLNEKLTDGVKVLQVYETGRKLRELALMKCKVMLEYDNGAGGRTCSTIEQLFKRDVLTVAKKTKSGMQDIDIIPMIRNLAVVPIDASIICIDALICCQNPSLNPMQLAAAIETYLPECKPDFAKCSRLEIYDVNETVFR